MADLREQALDVARSHLQDSDMMLPFALVSTAGGLKCMTIVTERSDTAMILGRRIVKAEGSADYAICVDAFVRIDGERRDAVFVELGSPGDPTAVVTAHPYRRDGGFAFDPPIQYERRPSALSEWDPFELEWGEINIDFVNEQQKLAVHAINHELGTADDVARTARFVRARIRHFSRYLPSDFRQLVHVEDRNRSVSTREALRDAIGTAAQVLFASERR